MKKFKGSFTVEAAYILPLVLSCICIVISLSISLHEEVRVQVETQAKEVPADMVKCMYRREFVKELFGELYED